MNKWCKLNKEFDDALKSMTSEKWNIWHKKFKNKTLNQNKMEKQEQKEMAFQLEAQLLINRFYELETDGKKMDYDTAVECAKVASKTIIESGNLSLPEDRLYWRCVLKQCDLLHSQEYLIESLKRDEKIYSHDDESGADGTQECDGISDEGLKGVCLDEMISKNYPIGIGKAKRQDYPTEKKWYLCRLNDPYNDDNLKLCYWNGQDWESMMHNEKLPQGRVKRWQDLTSIKHLASCLYI